MKNSSHLTMATILKSNKAYTPLLCRLTVNGRPPSRFFKVAPISVFNIFLAQIFGHWTFWTFFSGFGHCQEGLGQAWAGKPVEWSSLAQVWNLVLWRLFREKKWTHNPFTSVGKVFKASQSRTFCRLRYLQDGLNSPHQFLLSSQWLVGRTRC